MLLGMPANARDLDALAAIVTPAYIAMNFAAVCVTYDPIYLAKTSGPHGTAIAYAQHVKDDVITSLSYGEASATLKTAADAARRTALQKLRTFHAQDPAIEKTRIREWCGSEAKEFIRAFIDYHDNNHDDLMSRVEQARQ